MTNRAPILPQPPPIRGSVHIHIERCKGCELCIDYCPTRVLELSPQFNVKGYHYPLVVEDNCITCQSCFVICPEFAIFATPAPSGSETSEATLPA
jgi:2-oxoglutarate ferredoxin oxidoreductase subunit delta